MIYVKDVTRVMTSHTAIYGYPSESLNMIGVTGTNGRTTVTHGGLFIKKGRKATLSQLNDVCKIGENVSETENTT